MREPIRVLRILTRANLGGPARQCLSLHPHFEDLGVQQLVAIGRVGEEESELPMPLLRPALEAERHREGAAGFVSLPELGARFDPAADLTSFVALRRLVRSFRPHLVHTHTSKAGILGSLLARRGKLPVVHSYHGHVLRDYFPPAVERAVRLVERRLSRRRAAVLCVSRSCGQELEDLDVVSSHGWQLVPPAVEPASPVDDSRAHRARLRARLGISPDVLAIAFCGRWVAIKDPALFVACLERLVARSTREVRAFAFGSGPRADLLTAASSRLPLQLMGARPEFPSLLPAFDVLLMTSKREGMPLAAIEALGAGVPVVGPRVPGLVDLEGSGVVLTDRTAEALAAAVLHPPPVPAARRRELRERHDPGRIARQLVACYKQVLAL